MKNYKAVTSLSRRVAAGLAAAFFILHSSFGIAAVPSAAVVEVKPTRVADLIILDRGFDGGLRQGMVCRVTRGTTEIAEILLVDLRPTCSSALILNVAAKQSIRAGDTVSVKILKT